MILLTSDVVNAKKITHNISFRCPSAALQIEPLPQPPEITIPKPKTIPPINPPIQKDFVTFHLLILSILGLKILLY